MFSHALSKKGKNITSANFARHIFSERCVHELSNASSEGQHFPTASSECFHTLRQRKKNRIASNPTDISRTLRLRDYRCRTLHQRDNIFSGRFVRIFPHASSKRGKENRVHTLRLTDYISRTLRLRDYRCRTLHPRDNIFSDRFVRIFPHASSKRGKENRVHTLRLTDYISRTLRPRDYRFRTFLLSDSYSTLHPTDSVKKCRATTVHTVIANPVNGYDFGNASETSLKLSAKLRARFQ